MTNSRLRVGDTVIWHAYEKNVPGKIEAFKRMTAKVRFNDGTVKWCHVAWLTKSE